MAYKLFISFVRCKKDKIGYNKDIEKVTSQRRVTVALQYSKVLTMFSFSPIVDFDIFVELYVFGTIALVLLSLIAHLFSSLLNVINEIKTPVNNDFYEQVKKVFAPPKAPDFPSFTIRELRSYIRENELHSKVRTPKTEYKRSQ